MEEQKKEKKRILQGSLMKNSIHILIGAYAVIAAAFICSYIIINQWYQKESIRSRQDFFARVADKVGEQEAEVNKLTNLVTGSTNVIDYLRADGFADRWEKFSAFKQLSANLMMLNDSIVAVSIYDGKNELIATQGTKFAAPEGSLLKKGMPVISDSVRVDREQKNYFHVVIPVYEKTLTGAYQKAGSVTVLFNTSRLEGILDLAASAYSDENSYMAILDQKGEVLAASGNPEIRNSYAAEERKEKDYLLFENKLPESGWKLIYLTGKASYMGYMNQVQMINILTYIVMASALAFMCYMMYQKVIKPIRRQMAFVVRYTQDTSQRLEVLDKNEFGELEVEINQMLDGIEVLNRRIVEEQNRRLELEYAKKQTEMIAYKSQINPHFMHNTLECIRGMALYRGEKEIARLTAAMSRMFQYNVKGDEMVTVKEMLRSLRDYAVIIEYRFMGKITIELTAQDSVLEWKLPKMLVQPLVENAVHHGVEPKVGRGLVQVEIAEGEGERLKITVKDDGCGMDAKNLERQRQKFVQEQQLLTESAEHQEIGVMNVSRRLRLFYGDSCAFHIDSREGEGTSMVLEVPGEKQHVLKKEESCAHIGGDGSDVSRVFGG